jgi:hypothetical protein
MPRRSLLPATFDGERILPVESSTPDFKPLPRLALSGYLPALSHSTETLVMVAVFLVAFAVVGGGFDYLRQ